MASTTAPEVVTAGPRRPEGLPPDGRISGSPEPRHRRRGGDPAEGRYPRQVMILLHTCAVLAWSGMFVMYCKLWLGPNEATGTLLDSATRVTSGTQLAPFQYRILVPEVLMWMNRQLAWPVGYGQAVLDAMMLAVGVGALHAMLRRLSLEMWVLPAALYGAFLGTGIMWWGKMETMTAFAAMTVATASLFQQGPRRWVLLAPSCVVLAGTRTDLMFALSAALLTRWYIAGRRPGDLVAGGAVACAGVVATVGLMVMYPDAHYEDGIRVVQFAYNVKPLMLATGAAFLVPVLGPYALIRSQPGMLRHLAPHRSTVVPLLALTLAELASVVVVGRLDEVRLFFPISGALIVLGILGWRALLDSARPDQVARALD